MDLCGVPHLTSICTNPLYSVVVYKSTVINYEKFFECTEDFFVHVIHRRRRTESTYPLNPSNPWPLQCRYRVLSSKLTSQLGAGPRWISSLYTRERKMMKLWIYENHICELRSEELYAWRAVRRGQGSNPVQDWSFSGFLFATAKVAYIYDCDGLHSYNSSLRSSHIWFSYIQKYINILSRVLSVGLLA